MVFRGSLFGMAWLAAGAAWGSFDLMLLPGADARTYRYDPINNVMLGSFANLGNANLIAADTRGLSYASASNSSAIQVQHYSTGLQAGLMTGNTARAIELAGDKIYQLSTFGSMRRMDLSGANGANFTINTASTWSSLSIFGSTLIALGHNTTSNQLTMQTMDLATLSLGSYITYSVTIQSGTTLGKAAAARNELADSQMMAFTYVSSSGALSVGRVNLNLAGQVNPINMTTTTLSGFSIAESMPSFVAAHNGFWLYGQDSVTATNANVRRFDISTNGLFSGISTTFAAPGGSFNPNTYMHPANIVAPEPAAFLPLGLGVLLMRRRRRR